MSFFNFLCKSKFNLIKALDYKKTYNKVLELGFFDKSFYLDSYPHVKDSGMDPLIHYMFHGYKEGKLPYASFNLAIKDENPLIYLIKNNLTSESSCLAKKNRIISTNRSFLSNYKFQSEPLVSIIIHVCNGLDYLKILFSDFDLKTNYSNYEIIAIVSDNNVVDYLQSLNLPIKIIGSEDDFLGKANGEYLLFLKDSMEPTFGWLNEMVGAMILGDKVGSVGSKIVIPYLSDIKNQDKSFTISQAGLKFEEGFSDYKIANKYLYSRRIFSNEVNHSKEVILNGYGAILIPKELYLDVGGFDRETFDSYGFVDLALKIHKKGFKSIYSPFALLFDYLPATEFVCDDYFLEKWGNYLFKSLLKDKIENKHFFTDKKLQFSIILSEEFDKNIIYNLAKDLNKQHYNLNLISDLDNLNLGKDCDILLSFNPKYNVNNVIARNNLVKIIVLRDYAQDCIINSYDIVFSSNESFVNSLDSKKVFLYVDSFFEKLMNVIVNGEWNDE